MDARSVSAAAKKLAQERFGTGVVQDAKATDYTDETGEKAYRVTIVVKEFDPDVLTTEARADVVRGLIRQLEEAGDGRFPFVSFIPSDELAELAADG